jgi:Rod binding domain-containing protein
MKVEDSSYRYIPPQVKKVATEMEQEFNRIMLDEMNKTVESDDDMATNYYKSLLTSEHAKIISETNGGLGVGKIILDQIYPQNLRNQEGLANYLRNGRNYE